MKKFLSILLVITMSLSITACGSVDDGTKGTYEGNGFVATWSKVFMGSTIRLIIKASEKNASLVREGYEITEELYNYAQDSEGNVIVPISMDKKIKKDTIEYDIKGLQEYHNEQGASVDILIKDAMGNDVIAALVVSCKVGKEIPLSLSITDADMAKLYVNVPVNGDGIYAVGFYNIADGVEIAINNPDGDEWSVLDYNKKMFKLGDISYRDGRLIIPVTSLKEGSGYITIKNLQKGAKYKLKIGVKAYYNDQGEFVDFNTILLSVQAVTEQTKVSEAKGYAAAKKAAKKMGISEEFEKVEIPEGFNVTDIDVPGGTEEATAEETQGGEGQSQGQGSSQGQGQGSQGQGQGGQSQGGQSQGGQGSGQSQGGTSVIIEPGMEYEEIIAKEKKQEKKLDELAQAVIDEDPASGKHVENPVFESEEARQEYIKAVKEEEKNMAMPDRVSSDNIDYEMIQCNLVDEAKTETSLILSSAKAVKKETLVQQYEGYREIFPDMQIKDVKIKGIDVTIVFANGFAAALFEKNGLNYVYEQMGVNYTEAQAINQTEKYIDVQASDVSKFAQS